MKKAGYDLAPLIERIVFAPLRFICEIRPLASCARACNVLLLLRKEGNGEGKDEIESTLVVRCCDNSLG